MFRHVDRLIDEPINSKLGTISLTVKIPALLTISLVSAIGGSLFLSGLLNFGIFGTNTDDREGLVKAEAVLLPLQVIEQFTEKQIEGADVTGSDLNIDENFVDPENHCEFCTRVEYVPGTRGVAGFAYTSDEPLDLSGAKKIRFWVMGEEGGEKVKFKAVGKKMNNADILNNDSLAIFESETFARTTKEVTLGNDWTSYEIDLRGADLRDITHPFALELTAGSAGEREVLYIKGVVVDDEPLRPEKALETVVGIPAGRDVM